MGLSLFAQSLFSLISITSITQVITTCIIQSPLISSRQQSDGQITFPYNYASSFRKIETKIEISSLENLFIIDAIPLSIGIEGVGGVMKTIFPKNTPIPSKKSIVFTRYLDSAINPSIRLFEGENALSQKNHFLGEFEAVGVPPAPRGDPQIQITFSIDHNGVLSLNAKVHTLFKLIFKLTLAPLPRNHTKMGTR